MSVSWPWSCWKFSVARSCGYASATANSRPIAAVSTFSASACCGDARRLLGRRPRAGHLFEGLLLVSCVPLDGLDQVGDQVVSLAELDVHLRPGVLGPVSQPNQLVEHPHQHEQEEDDDRGHDDDHPDHEANPMSRAAREPDRILAAFVGAAVEPAVTRLRPRSRPGRAERPIRSPKARRGSCWSRTPRRGHSASAAEPARPSRHAPRSPVHAPTTGRPSLRRPLGDGAKTSNTRRPPGTRSPRARRSAASRSSSVGEVEVGAERAGDELHRLRDGRVPKIALPEVEERSDARRLRPFAANLEHPRRRVDSDQRHARLGGGNGNPAGADAELDHCRPTGAAGSRRLASLGDVEPDVLGDAPAPRVVELGDPVVGARRRAGLCCGWFVTHRSRARLTSAPSSSLCSQRGGGGAPTRPRGLARSPSERRAKADDTVASWTQNSWKTRL